MDDKKRFFLLSSYSYYSGHRYFYYNCDCENPLLFKYVELFTDVCESVNMKGNYVAFSQRLTFAPNRRVIDKHIPLKTITEYFLAE